MAGAKDNFQACSDWFSFHLSHLEDFQLSKLESLWPECKTCRAVYESLNYTSTEGEFGLMTREILENLAKRQRVKPKLTEPHFRRGNVPQYISFVEPMPVHQRPGTGKTSGYESCGISLVSEDLLVSAGTQEEIVDSGEESELDIGYERLVLCGGLEPRAVNIDDVSQEPTFSSRSSFNKSDIDGSLLDAEESNMEEREDSNMSAGEGQDKLVSVEQPSGVDMSDGDLNERNSLTDKMLNEETKKIDRGDFDASQLSESQGTNADDRMSTTSPDDIGAIGYEDSRNNSLLLDLEQQKPVDAENNFDTVANDNETPSDQVDQSDTAQVTFSEPLVTDRRLSASVAVDDTKTESPKSILKGTESDKNVIYERELDSSIKKRMTSPTEEAEKSPTKPAMTRRSGDLRPQSRPDIILSDRDSSAQSRSKQEIDQETEQGSSDEDGVSDSDLHSSTGAGRRRKPKPKNSIYGRRANMKAPSQKLRKKKDSNNSDCSDDDLIMSAESALLMEQILEQEKRLKEGIKPWLKGRLALSQQNSRFEIPMDVRLLETMTPMEYLTRYCVISKRRKALYQHVFQKVDRNRDGIINFTEMEKGLKDVHIGILESEHVENIFQMIHIDKEGDFDLKQFSAVAAFSERISCKHQLPVEMLNNFDGQKEVIECADFFALNWKLDGIKVNPEVKKILDSL